MFDVKLKILIQKLEIVILIENFINKVFLPSVKISSTGVLDILDVREFFDAGASCS